MRFLSILTDKTGGTLMIIEGENIALGTEQKRREEWKTDSFSGMLHCQKLEFNHYTVHVVKMVYYRKNRVN